MQTDIDIAYDSWCKTVKHEMYDKLSFNTIYPDTIYSIRKRSPKPWCKPWWNDNLSILFKKVHQAERDWLKCNDRAKKIVLKHEYVLLRKHFGKEVQSCKRLHWYKTQKSYWLMLTVVIKKGSGRKLEKLVLYQTVIKVYLCKLY